MKSFFWKFVLCLIPCLLAAWVTIDAVAKYRNGESGGFKLGPDLEGGTILVYEIDLLRSALSAGGDKESAFDAKRDINILTDALKKRIDPNDLYNIVIRPAGTEGRVEIILPTGGPHRMKKSVDAWKSLLKELTEKTFPDYFKDKDIKIEVERGRFLELGDRIQFIASWDTWEKELFGKDKDGEAAWKRLKEKAVEDYPQLNFDYLLRKTIEKNLGPKLEYDLQQAKLALSKAEENKELAKIKLQTERIASLDKKIAAWNSEKAKLMPEIEKEEKTLKAEKAGFEALDTKPNRLKDFVDFAFVTLREKDPTLTEKVLQNWVKKRAWEETLLRVQNNPEWKDLHLELSKDDVKKVLPDNFDQLITFVQTKGVVPTQAVLASLEPLIGKNYVPADSPKYKEVYEFIAKHYGPSITEINDKIDLAKKSGHFRDLSVEEVERIKELVKKVGSLEFRILANSVDDEKAINENMAYINGKGGADSADLQAKLDFAKENGLPPPVVMEPNTTIPKKYLVDLGAQRDEKANLQYAWVELGPQERRSLSLDNAAKDDPTRNFWHQYLNQRLEQAVQLPEDRNNEKKFRMAGSLFYARRCENRHMTKEERDNKGVEYFILTRLPEISTIDGKPAKISGDYISYAGASFDNVSPAVNFHFNDAGARLFSEITRKNVPVTTGGTEIKRHLAIILDDFVVSAPTINSVIGASGQITGNFTRREVDDLVNVLRAGRLPATLKPEPVSENTMGATLGVDTIQSGVQAVILAFVAILAFMIVYYRFAGFVASVALLANLLLTVGFMVTVQATFTLPGLAGLVLMLGMAVDANILIYERLREERERGAALPLAIRNGYDHALPTIIDTHLSSIFTAIVLYVVGNDQLKGFGVSLTVGLVISLFTSLFMTRLMFDFWLAKGWLTQLNMFRLFAKPNINFMSIRNFMFGLTLVISILGIVIFVARLPYDLDIDFVGGTAFGAKLKDSEAKTLTQFRELLSDANQHKYLKLKSVEKLAEDGTRWKLTYNDPPADIVVSFSKDDAPRSEAEAKSRAELIPDISIEQIFLSSDGGTKEANASHRFTIRTSEKEPRLVQASLLRLLKDYKNGKNLDILELAVPEIEGISNRETRVFFQHPAEVGGAIKLKKKDELTKEEQAFASPSFFKGILTRQLLDELGVTDKNYLPSFEIIGERDSTEDRSYHSMRVRFEKELPEDERAKVQTALAKTLQEFQRPQPYRLEKFDSQLATETRFRAMWAIIASWGAILLYLWFRFGNWTFGLAAVLCLVHDLFFTLGAIAICHYLQPTFIGQMLALDDFKINLPAVAALLTLVGYSVNDTIVVFDRIREVRGKNPILTAKMINDSINQTLSRTVLASLATWLVVFVLYVWGGQGVHLFAFVMVVGVIVGTYSSIYIASPLLLIFGEGIDHDLDKPITQKA